MDKQIFKKNQPIVYRILSQALRNKTVSHAYLFCGPSNSLKEECALLFAQSLVCPNVDKDGFACQKCDQCRHYAKEESFDFLRLKEDPIKKKSILAIQQAFSSTAISQLYRIYILEHFDHCTPEAGNTLLKFLEEPRPGIVGILIADDLSNVLDTIQSRTQIIQFRPLDQLGMQKELEKFGDGEKAKMLSISGYTLEESRQWMEKEEFAFLQEEAKKYVEQLGEMSSLYRLQRDVFFAKSQYKEKEYVRIWLKWIVYYIKYTKIFSIDPRQKNEIFMILIEAFDRLRRPVDLALMIDQIHYRIRKAVKL